MNKKKDYKILVVVYGFLGDALLSQPIAERLKTEHQATKVDFLVGFPQTQLLLEQNPNIDNVIISSIFSQCPNPHHISHLYDEVRIVENYTGNTPLTIHHQISAGVRTPTLGYEVYTVPEYDNLVQNQLKELDSRPVVGIGNTWKVNPTTTYDINPLSEALEVDYNVMVIGHPPNISHHQIINLGNPQETFAYMASVCNLAAGVGCTVLYTTDFMYALAGPQGTHYQNDDPTKLIGPKAYFPNSPHIQLPPNITVGNYIESIVPKVNDFFNM